MLSQTVSHNFDHQLTPQASHSNHIRHVSNASSISSLGSSHPSFEPSHYSQSQPSQVHDAFAVPSSFQASSITGGAALSGPVPAEAFHQYVPHHHRSSSTSSSSSPYTEPTSISEGNSPEDGVSNGSSVPGGRKASQAQMMRRARTHASPYTVPTDSMSWNAMDIPASNAPASASSLVRSNSVIGDAPTTAEEEIVELMRCQSRESSVSEWYAHPPQGYQHHAQQHPGPHHQQTGLGSAGTFFDPYAAVTPAHGQAGTYGSAMVPYPSGPSSNLGGVPVGGMVGMGGMMNTWMVGGMGAQMGRMSLDCTEAYEALAHHIRTAITTSAADRARQAFVQAWLNSSYVSYPDGNVSRQGLYGSYLQTCQRYDIKPINSASFGKAVRQSFPNIKTRRLGVRGNSKYHYCGIRPRTAEEAEILVKLSQTEKPEPLHGSRNPSCGEEDLDSDGSPSRQASLASSGDEIQPVSHLAIDGEASVPDTPRTARPSMAELGRTDSMSSHAYRSGGSRNMNVNDFYQSAPLPSLDESLSQPAAQDLDHARAQEFWKLYTEHAQGLMESVKSYRFDQFELSLRTFWAGLDPGLKETVIHPVLMSLIYRTDAVIYDEILDYLHSQTLTQMPQQAFGSLRQLARSMEQVIIVAMENYPSAFVGPKIELAARFGHLIVRHLGICQLAQALSGVFSNPNNLKEMAEAWDGIDLEAVRNQAALVTNCQHDILGVCFDDFRQILFNPAATMDHLIAFVEGTYEKCLQPINEGERGLSPRSLLVRWCFVSSQLIRDLTLRSASSFGSFQIVNLFFDEWLGFKVLRKVALHVAAVAATVDPSSPEMAAGCHPQVSDPSLTLSQGPPSQQLSNSFGCEGLELESNRLQTHSLGGNGPVAPVSDQDLHDDRFMFSPNTTQAFGAAQQQVVGGGEGSASLPISSPHSAGLGVTSQQPPQPAESSHSNASTPLAGQTTNLLTSPAGEQPRSPSTAKPNNAETVTQPQLSNNGLEGNIVQNSSKPCDSSAVSQLDDCTLGELLDVGSLKWNEHAQEPC